MKDLGPINLQPLPYTLTFFNRWMGHAHLDACSFGGFSNGVPFSPPLFFSPPPPFISPDPNPDSSMERRRSTRHRLRIISTITCVNLLLLHLRGTWADPANKVVSSNPPDPPGPRSASDQALGGPHHAADAETTAVTGNGSAQEEDGQAVAVRTSAAGYNTVPGESGGGRGGGHRGPLIKVREKKKMCTLCHLPPVCPSLLPQVKCCAVPRVCWVG